VYTPIQRHTSRVIKLTKHPGAREVGDAVITNVKGLEIGVKTADCVPIILIGEEWVGAIHAGWRGLASGIIQKTVEEMKREEVRDLTAFVFPSARSCCYEVGEEFVSIFGRNLINRNGKLFFDTQAEAVAQLRESGVRDIIVWGACTVCTPYLPSYRRDKTSRRLTASIKIKTHYDREHKN